MKKTKIILGVTALLVTTCFTVFAQAATFTVEQAKKIAENYIPKNSTFIKADNENNEYELKYYNESKQEKYELDIDKTSQKLVKFESQTTAHDGSLTVKITEDKAKEIVKKEFPNAENISVYLDTDNGFKEYKVSFQYGDFYGTADINPETGIITERKLKASQPYNNSISSTTNFIGEDTIKKAVQKYVPNGIITDVDLEKSANGAVFEIEIHKDDLQYNLILNASTGEKISLTSHIDDWDNDSYHFDWDWEHDAWQGNHNNNHTNSNTSANNSIISIEKAKQIALDKIPGAIVKKIELDTDDGKTVYEGELRKGNWEYEFKIDAFTGTILEWDSDFDD